MGSLRLVRVETSGSGEWGHNVSDKYRPDGGDWERMYCSLETEGEEVLDEKNEKQFDLDLNLSHDPNGDNHNHRE